MYSTSNEGKSVVAERFIRTLKKNIYFDVLNDIVNKYNSPVHKTIKMKPTDVTDDSYAEYNENFNKKDPNLKFVTMLEFPNTITFLLKDML